MQWNELRLDATSIEGILKFLIVEISCCAEGVPHLVTAVQSDWHHFVLLISNEVQRKIDEQHFIIYFLIIL